MSGLGWAGVALAAASIALGLIAILGAEVLRSDMYKTPDKTAWGLIELIVARFLWHHHGSERDGHR